MLAGRGAGRVQGQLKHAHPRGLGHDLGGLHPGRGAAAVDDGHVQQREHGGGACAGWVIRLGCERQKVWQQDAKQWAGQGGPLVLPSEVKGRRGYALHNACS